MYLLDFGGDTVSSDSYQISEQIWLGHIGTTICHILGTAVVDPLIGLGGVYCCIDPGSHVLQEQLGRVLQRKVCWCLRPKLKFLCFGVLRLNFWVVFLCHVKKPSKPQGIELHCFSFAKSNSILLQLAWRWRGRYHKNCRDFFHPRRQSLCFKFHVLCICGQRLDLRLFNLVFFCGTLKLKKS